LTKRSELLPRHVYILAERASAYRAMGDFEHAFADYAEAIKRSPNDARFRQARARLYLERGDDASALADLTAAIEVAPAARDLYTDRARIYRSHGDVAAAEADENRARNVPRNWPDPGEFMLFLALGLLLSWPKAILCPAGGYLHSPARGEHDRRRRGRRCGSRVAVFRL
jgi:tetratricopeptide (TPR) repeat protein